MTTVVLNTVTRKVEVFSSARDVQARAEIADHKAAADPHPQYLADAQVADVALSGDAGDLIAGTVPDARMPSWAGYSVASRTALEAANVPAAVGVLRLSGHAAAGDGGGAVYKRAASEPVHAGKIQSADGTWWEIAENVINVLQFGAVADDSTDNATAIQNALSAGWDTVRVPAGTYQTSTLTIPAGTTLLGEGTAESIIKLLDGSAGVAVIQQTSAAENIHLRHLRIDGNRDNTGPGIAGARGVHFVDVTNSSITFCHITGARFNGINWFGCSGNLIAFNKVNNNGSNGIRCDTGTTGDQTRIIGNHCHENGGLIAVANGGIGISVAHSTNFVIAGNVCANNENNGIDLWDMQDTVVSGNICSGSVQRSGIAPDGGAGVGDLNENIVITGNICRNNAQYGIVLANECNHCLISHNILRSNTIAAFRDDSTPSVNIRVYDNLGHVTENQGIITVGATDTSIAVTHSLHETPDRNDIQITPRTNWGSITKWWVSAADATTFTFNVDVAPGGAGAFFGWSHRKSF